MDRVPEDPEARREWLERWASEKQRQLAQREPTTNDRLRRALARRAEPLQAASSGLEAWTNARVERVLDRGLATAGDVEGPEHEHPDRVLYTPSAWHVLPRALRHLGAGAGDTFVDFGCGKGRVLNQAARWPLRRVIGVEISAALAEEARRVLAADRTRHRCRDVEVVVADAAQFEVPDDMTIGYLFQPFVDDTLDAVTRRIIESLDRRPRRVRLVYVYPRAAGQILATGRFRLAATLRGGLRDRRISRAAILASYVAR